MIRGKHRRKKEPLSPPEASLPLDAAGIPLGYICLDKDGRVLGVNPKWYEILGYTRDEVQGRWFGDLVAPTSRKVFQARFTELPRRGEILNVELAMVHKDGHLVTILFNGTVERDSSGQIMQVHSFLHNVTEVLSDQHLLERGEKRFGELFRHMSSCVAVYEARSAGEDFVFVDFNDAAEKVDQVARGDIVGKSVLEVFPSVRDFGLFEVFQRVWRTGNPEHHPVALYRDRRILGWKENYVYKLPSGEVVAIYDDVTERKQAEEALWIQGRAIESSANAIAMADLAGNLVYVNAAFLHIWGYTDRTEILGRPSLEFSQEKEGTSAILEALSHGGGWLGEMTATRKDGSHFDVQVSASMIRDEVGRPLRMLGVFVDVTERKKAEERIRWISRFPDENPNSVLRIASDGTLLFANEASAALLAVWGCHVDGPVPADTRRLVRRTLEEGIQTVEMQTGGRFFLLTLSPVVDDGYVNVYSVDITELKKAGAALRESEEKYRSVVENASEGIVIIQDGCMKYANPALARLTGRTVEDITSRPVTDHIHPEDQARVAENEQRRLDGEKVETSYEFRILTGKGAVRWVQGNAVRVNWEGRPAILNLVSDVTERKEAAECLKRAQDRTIRSVGAITEMRDPYTAGHQERVTALACAIAGEMGLAKDKIDGLRVAAQLHDIGKMSVPAEILSTPAKLTEAQFALMKEHPQTAYEILEDIEFPWPIADIVLQHHERLDGSGYPKGLSDKEICLEAKILAVADTVEAMASHRPYRPSLGIDAALAEIAAHAGTRFDPLVVDACLVLFKEQDFTFDDAHAF